MHSDEGWVFVSHSNRDFDRVRRVRNALEDAGHYPLLFFLRCLTDDQELDDLIKREICERNFFLYCKSEAARTSPWVQRELAFIKSLPHRVIYELSLDDDEETQATVIRDLSRS